MYSYVNKYEFYQERIMRYKKEGVGARSSRANNWIQIISPTRCVTIFRTPGCIARVGIVSQHRIRHGLRVRVLATRRERYDSAFRHCS